MPTVSFDELITAVRDEAGSDDPLARLATAARLATTLAETGDALLGHFVDQCRRAGHSWTEIGAALGVTRQAAQKRWVRPPTDRYTERAKRVLEAALAASNDLGHNFVGTEHLLIALFDEPGGMAARVLSEAGLDKAAVVTAVLEKVPRDSTGGGGFTPKATNVIEQHVVAEALSLGHNYVGTEHLLLALYREATGVAAMTLQAMGLDADAARAAVIECHNRT